MLALQNTRNGLDLNRVDRPKSNGEVLVRVTASGICSTDLEITRGYSGFFGTLGHEFAGVVEYSEDSPDLIGKRVVGEINAGCGRCHLCVSGDPRHCPDRTVLGIKGRDGAHAEFLSLPLENLLVLPDEITDRDAVFVEPLAAALGITERLQLHGTERIAVIGDGKLGLLCAFVLAKVSAQVTLIGKHASKLRLADKRGIRTLKVKDEFENKEQFDVVIEASGANSGFALALDLVKPRGHIVLKSTYSGLAEWESWRVVVDEISVVGSRCGRFGPAIELMKNGDLGLNDLISEEFPLSKGVDAFGRADRKGCMKVLLFP